MFYCFHDNNPKKNLLNIDISLLVQVEKNIAFSRGEYDKPDTVKPPTFSHLVNALPCNVFTTPFSESLLLYNSLPIT